MTSIEIRIWRNPPREEVLVEGEALAQDVLVKLSFEDVPLTTTLGELMGTFDHRVVADRSELQHPACPGCRCLPEAAGR